VGACEVSLLTVDEEISLLDDTMRRLKVEYDVYFGGGKKKPPSDLEWKVQSLLKKYSDSQRLSFAQRFRYTSIAQRYAVFSELWRQKLRIKEEGYRRPEDAALSIQGLRTEQERTAARSLQGKQEPENDGPAIFRVECGDVADEQEQIRTLFDAMLDAKRRTGESSPNGKFEGFLAFIRLKTDEIRRDFHCPRVEFSVGVRDNKVRLTAKARE
jgi:hypothetical protein